MDIDAPGPIQPTAAEKTMAIRSFLDVTNCPGECAPILIRKAFFRTDASISQAAMGVILWAQRRVRLCGATELTAITRHLINSNFEPESFRFRSFCQLVQITYRRLPSTVPDIVPLLVEFLLHCGHLHVISKVSYPMVSPENESTPARWKDCGI
jgi:hypothetical protein